MTDLLEWTEGRAVMGVEAKYVTVFDRAIFCTDPAIFGFAKTWGSVFTMMEQQDFVGASRDLFAMGERAFKWCNSEDSVLKVQYPIAFHEHGIWLAGNLCICIGHFKMIEKITDRHDIRAGLFRSLQTLASKSSPYGGVAIPELEQSLNIVQMRCLEEAQMASAHWHFNARRLKEAATLLEELAPCKRVTLLQQTLKSYNKGAMPQTEVYSLQLLAPAVDIPVR
jgi:hypothetical protein